MNIKLLILELHSGFCNRMFPLLSSYYFCKQHEIHIDVIWKNNTCRYCIQNNNSDNYYTLSNYYDDIPTNISIHKNIESIIKKHKINKKEITKINMHSKNNMGKDILHILYPYLFNVCHILSFTKEINVNMFCPYPTTKISNYEYLAKLNNCVKDFRLNNTLLHIINEFDNFDIGVHLRTTDGGFKNNDKKLLGKINKIIHGNNDKRIFFCSDDKNNSQLIKNKHSFVVQYMNNKKFENSDIGSFYSLVDLYLLSKCATLYVTQSSSFSLFAFVINNLENKKIEYL